jgi:hypothetical protein
LEWEASFFGGTEDSEAILDSFGLEGNTLNPVFIAFAKGMRG